MLGVRNLKRCVLIGVVPLILAMILGALPQEDSIILAYKGAIAADPNDVVAHFNLGLAFYKMEQFKEAKEALEKCLQLNRGDQAAHKQVDGPAYQLLGIIYYSQEKEDRRAIDMFKKSLEYFPDDPDTHYAMGLSYIRLKEYTNAVQSLKKALEKGKSQDVDVYYQLGRTYIEMGQEAEAIANYERALELNPDFQPILESLGLLYHRQKKDDEAIKILKHLVELEPMNFNANYLLGLNYYRKKMYSEMVAAYNRAVAVQPDLADAHYNLGMAYYYQTRYDLAIDALKKAVTFNPKDAEAYNLLGQAQTAAVEKHLQQGSLFIAKEQYNEAMDEFQKILQIDADHRKAKMLLEDTERKLREELQAHLGLAEKFYQESRLDDAYNEYELALKLDPNSQPARDGMNKARVEISNLLANKIQKGKLAEKTEDYQSAKQLYDAALRLKPNFTQAQQAIKELENKLENKMKTLLVQAQKQFESNTLREAARTFQRIRELAGVFEQSEWEERALSGLTRTNSKNAELIKQYLDEGRQAYKNKANVNAQKAFNLVLALDPQNKVANEYILKLTGSQSQATVTAEKIKEMYYKGVDLYVKGQIEDAIKAWQEVLALEPDNQDAQINIERAQSKLIAIRRLTEGK